jgi:hypothetical protein
LSHINRRIAVSAPDPNLAHVQCPNPLKPEDLAAINQALQGIHATLLLIGKCETCGIPVDQAKADNLQQQELLTNLKRQFFPNSS